MAALIRTFGPTLRRVNIIACLGHTFAQIGSPPHRSHLCTSPLLGSIIISAKGACLYAPSALQTLILVYYDCAGFRVPRNCTYGACSNTWCSPAMLADYWDVYREIVELHNVEQRSGGIVLPVMMIGTEGFTRSASDASPGLREKQDIISAGGFFGRG